jgi:hypothetical protein
MENKTPSVEQSLLIHALRCSPKGFALIRASKIAWANAAFYEALGLDPASSLGRRVGDVWAVCGGFNAGLAAAFERCLPWEGRLAGDGDSALSGALTPMGAGEAGLWIDRDPGQAALEGERIDHMLQGVQEWPSASERSEFGGPKSFWRSVGAVWAVCSRNNLPVALAFASAGGADEALAREELRQALSLSFRRASDVLGRLGNNQYGVFIVGQDARQVAERLRFAGARMPAGSWAACAVVGGAPKQGTSSHAIKAQAKKLHDAVLERGQGAVDLETF